jgi:C_GCAxxG_C_C family probable redox protein
MEKGRAYWGRRAAVNLIKDLNCALASHETVQDMIGRRDDTVLKAVTGLEGGVVASGSTCGVISGGALGLALAFDRELREHGTAAEFRIMDLVRQYSGWFGTTYGTPFCRQRSRTDFYKTGGQIRYFLPGDLVAGCLWHIRGALRYLNDVIQAGLPHVDSPGEDIAYQPRHCALEVLRAVRENTGLCSDQLDRIAFVLDGGVGLGGGVCGALIGAILGINLRFGMDIRQENLWGAAKAFLIGHVNLLKDKPIGAPEPFCVGKEIVASFKERAGSMNCRDIVGRNFTDYREFMDYFEAADGCRDLIAFAAEEASGAVRKWAA